MDQSVIEFDNAIDEWRGCLRACVRANVGQFEQLCDNNNIHSAVWMKFFFTNMMQVLILFGNFMTNLNFWFPKGNAATYLKCGGK